MSQLKMKDVSLVIVSNMKKGCYQSCKRKATIFNWLSKLSRKNILVLNLDRSDTVKLLKAADLFLFLSNIECSPLVLFEAGAAGVPFISTDVGNSAEIAAWTGGGLIIDGDKDQKGLSHPSTHHASEMVKQLLLDTAWRSRLGTCAREKVMKNYTWLSITKRYLKLYTG
jgi:glycosyltransferase involved in cell wall biosynthesis